MKTYGYVFFLKHKYYYDVKNDIMEVKEIGVYSTKRMAEEAIGRFRNLAGFISHPEGFMILKQRCYLENTQKLSTGQKIYQPYHERYIPEQDCDFVTRGSFFDSYDQAAEVLNQWGAAYKKEGDSAVIEFTLDQDSRFWNEGFD